VQRFFYERRSVLIARARHSIPVLDGVADLYRERVGHTAQRERSGRQIINQLVIDRTAFNPVTRLPLLFGSSLKGAIRTALLDSVNRSQAAPERKGLHEFQGRLFHYYDRRLFLERDPMRLIQIGDATWHGQPELPASEVHLAVNRKKAPVLDERGNLRRSRAEQKGLYQILECIPALRYRALDAQLNIQSLDRVDKPGELPHSSLRFDIHYITRACNDFYRPILMEENSLLVGRGFLRKSWRNAIEALLTGEVGRRIDRGDAFLVRVGRHSGAESVTLREVRRLKIMKASNQPPEDAPSAKTDWLGAQKLYQQENMLPFGWLLVEVFPVGGQPPEECEELKTACETHLGPARTWAARQAHIAAEMARQKAQEDARRRQQEEQDRLRAEEKLRAAKLEADRTSRLAAMSDEERAIEDLRALYERDKNAGRKEPQGELASRRVNLLRQAKGWDSAEIRRKAADLIEETARWLPWGGNKQKVAERLKNLGELRKP
jgi:CRISPR-associated protein Csm5